MIPGYPDLLYTQLLSRLGEIQAENLAENKELEESFGVAMYYEQQLMNWVIKYRFESEADEIQFYKVIRPKYIAYIEYLKKRYHAALFRPVGKKEQVYFYEYEVHKVERFLAENAAFYQYYKSRQDSDDKSFFLNATHKNEGAGYDVLAGSILGLEKYIAYAQERLTQMRREIEQPDELSSRK